LVIGGWESENRKSLFRGKERIETRGDGDHGGTRRNRKFVLYLYLYHTGVVKSLNSNVEETEGKLLSVERGVNGRNEGKGMGNEGVWGR
jgi:hypothetical protein